jgi:thioredoxin-related protein
MIELYSIINKKLKNIVTATRLIGMLFSMELFPMCNLAQDIKVNIHLSGVYESKISLLSLSGMNTLKSIAVVDSVKNGETTTIQVSVDNLPGEFVLRFDYIENETSGPYTAEKRIIIYNQDLFLRVNPIYSNNIDSTWFQKEEKENTIYLRFLMENARQKEMLSLLQNFLLRYDDRGSAFYKKGISEYEKRRRVLNNWIIYQIKQYKNLFVSNLFGFQYIPKINWEGNEADRKQSLRDNYIKEMDFNEPFILKTTRMKEWMDGYVNLYGELATNITQRDSLFTYAGKTAIEKARTGHPEVYGWMVDYFFNGYESFNIEEGIKMLEPYMNDPNCLTTKRQEIKKRLMGIKTLVPGITAPNIIMHDAENLSFELNTHKTKKKYILLLFWSADCSHCEETVSKLYPLYQQAEIQKNLDIVAISMDETDTEIMAWQKKIEELKGWTHIRATEGLRSKVANDYSILGIPVMVLINAKNHLIIALPESAEQLKVYLTL